MMNYDDLASAYRTEKSSPELTPLSDGFYEEAKALCNLPEAAEYKDSMQKTLEEIFGLRVNKLIHYAGRATAGDHPPKNSLKLEADLYGSLMDSISAAKRSILESSSQKKAQAPVPDMVSVKLLHALPAMVGADSADYGPFKADDQAELPKETALLLIDRGMAELI